MYDICICTCRKSKRNVKKGRNETEVQEIKIDFIYLKRLKKDGSRQFPMID